MATGSTAHIVMQGTDIFCTHCGTREPVTYPITPFALKAISDAMTKEHRRCKPDPRVAEREEQRRKDATRDPISWRLGPDTGISSVTIWSVMTGRPFDVEYFDPDVPRDPADFGRCYRLLQAFPSWLPRLAEVAQRYPKWGPMVREWDAMTALYEREIKRPDGRAPELYELMKTLEGEGYEAIGQKNPYRQRPEGRK